MKAEKLISLLATCVEHREPVLVKGAPGIGKSDIVSQVAKMVKHNLVIFHPVVSDPTDFKGLPCVTKDGAEFLPYGDLRKLLDAKTPTIAFLDDIGQAPAVVQAALMQLLLARQVNGHKIADCVTFIAATNRREDKAGVTGILEPVKSRFTCIVELDVSVESWIDWAMKNEQPSEIIGFVYFMPGVLANKFQPTNDIVNQPCPRTIAAAGRLIKMGLTDIESLSGAVGEGTAIELTAFLKVCKNLPNIEKIIKDPEKAEIPEAVDVLYAVVAALIEKSDEKNSNNIIKYARRIKRDFGMLLVRDMARKNKNIIKCSEMIKWAQENKDILV